MVAEETVAVGGLRLRVRRSGAGAPLLLINGLGATLEMWEPLTEGLGERELIAFDLPGAGRSSSPRRPLRMPGLADVVAGLLDALGHREADVLGYSLGGAVAQELARRHAARVRRLVLCATSPGMPSVPPNALAAFCMLTPARYYDPWLAQLIVPVIAGGRTARDQRALEAGLAQRLKHPPTPWGYALQLYAFLGWSSHPWLGRLRQPTLVLHGDDDPLVPLVNASYMARAIPHARLEVIARAGHLLLFDEPERAAPAIVRFLRRDRPEGVG